MNQQHAATLADDFLRALRRDPNTPPPADLDPALVSTIRLIAARQRPPDPRPEFVADLRARLLREATQRSARPRPARGWWSALLRPQPALRFATLLAIVAVAAIAWWALRTPSVSAEEIVRRAQAVAASPATSQITSFALTEVRTSTLDQPPDPGLFPGATAAGQRRDTERRWYDRGKSRSERSTTWVEPDGRAITIEERIDVDDGTTHWQYDPRRNVVTVERRAPDASPAPPNLGLSSRDPFSDDPIECFRLERLPDATIAGRPTYVISFVRICPPERELRQELGRRIEWIDQETYFVLKTELRSRADDAVLWTDEITEIAYNPAIDAARFQFSPPPDASIDDRSATTGPEPAAYQQQLDRITRQAQFPVFVPRSLPRNLVPLLPDGLNDVLLRYVPLDRIADPAASADRDGVTIAERVAQPPFTQPPSEPFEVLEIQGRRAYYTPGTPRPDGSWANRALLLVRDGTLILLRSERLSKDELIAIADALEPVPASNAAPADALRELPAIDPASPSLPPDEIAAIERAVRGDDSAVEYQIVLEAVLDDYARVRLVPNDPGVEQATVYLQRIDGVWTRLGTGPRPPDDPFWQQIPEPWRPQMP